jgi:hypothetical protein
MMKKIKILFVLFLGAVLTGCFTTTTNVETPLSKEEQAQLLKKTKPPQTFGFDVFRIPKGIGFRGRARLHPEHISSVDMIKDGFPLVSVQGRARRDKMNVLFDLHSNVSWIELTKAQEFKVDFLGFSKKFAYYHGKYNTGGIPAYAGVISQIRFSNFFMENIPFYVRMARGSLGLQNRGIKKPHVDAVLGYDNLKGLEYIQINPFGNKIKLSATIPYVPHDALLQAKLRIVHVPGFGLAVKGSIDGKPTAIVLDFVGDLYFSCGGVPVGNKTKSICLGDVCFVDVLTYIIPGKIVPPRIGNRLLKDYIVTVCPKKGIVYFERPPE